MNNLEESMNVKRILFFSVILSLLWLAVSLRAAAAPNAKTYLVNSDTNAADANPGDGVCATGGGNCTLHAAIQEANLDGQASTIQFAYQFQATHAIDGCSLPALTENSTTIDGSNRWDNSINRPGIEISGSACDLLVVNSSSNTILGILFGGGNSIGVHVTGGSSNTIGGSGQGQRNVFLTSKYGVWLQSAGINNSVVYNYFGTATGESIPGLVAGDSGIYAWSEQNTISNNLIVGYSIAGITLSYSDNNTITDNIIGLNRWKQGALGNKVGIYVAWSKTNTIGPDNVIAGNASHGIETYHAEDTTISGNLIGYPYTTVGIGNGGDGVHLHAAINTIINKGNSICCNTENGVWLDFDDVTIQGNGIGDNDKDGIYIAGVNSRIGGSTEQERNVIGSNKGSGIHLDGADNITITGNYIGLDGVGAFDNGNEGYGILVENGSTDNVIGGDATGEGNLIAYNHKTGIQIQGAATQNNLVAGNVLGTPIHWAWEAGNGWHGIGIYDGAHNNRVGTIDPGASNIVLASGWSGIVIVNSSDNAIIANRIGTDGASVQWGNAYYGVNVAGSGTGNAITFNEIAYNGTHNGQDGAEAGIEIDGSLRNAISQNSIHDNDGPGISLVNGGNGNLPAPTISQASCQGPVSGKGGGPLLFIQIFSDGSDEGRVYEGTTQVNTVGDWVWNGQPSGPYLTATARDQSNNTSPFSAPFNLGTCNTAPTAAFSVQPPSGNTETNFLFDASSSSDAEDPASALQVRWDWQNDGVYDTTWSTNKSASHKFSLSGVHTVRLQVRDTAGLTGQATRQVTITGQINKHIYLPVVGKDMP
jgi:parallel beta-helix repeat protein